MRLSFYHEIYAKNKMYTQKSKKKAEGPIHITQSHRLEPYPG
jgi:hypothetical protein